MDKEIIKSLAEKVAAGLASAGEISQYNKLCLMMEGQTGEWDETVLGNKAEIRSLIQQAIEKKINRQAPVFSIIWKRWTIAASILLVVGLGSYFAFFNKQTPTPDTPQLTADIKAPDKTRATITLADGRTVSLDSLTTITLDNTTVIKTPDGKIIYSSTPSAVSTPTAVLYNTLTNPRGSKVIDMQLSDGSHVWLNAGSSITYPIAFIGDQRKVTMTGEGYFEIAKDTRKKFIVEANGTATEVLGTHFNINAYNDEAETKITLLEGSVSVSSVKSSVPSVLKITPGQQAVLTANGQLTTNNPDLSEITAWRDNRFYFMSLDINSIAKQLERWYDVDITVQPGFTNHFTGIISRSVNASEVFRMLQQTGTLKVKIDGRKIEISR